MPRKKKEEKEAAEATEQTEIKETATAELSEGVAEKVKEPEIELVEELVRYEFTDDELLMLGSSVASLMESLERIRAEAKSAASGYKSDIEKKELDIAAVITCLRDKFEMRRTECYCVKDWRERKAYYLLADRYELEFLKSQAGNIGRAIDDGLINPAKVRDLKSWELQRELEFKNKSDGSEPGEAGTA